MKSVKAIRIIKKSERNSQPEAPKAAAPTAGETIRQSTREVAGQVATWVKEFQQRRRPDARRAFASLFGEQTSPLGTV